MEVQQLLNYLSFMIILYATHTHIHVVAKYKNMKCVSVQDYNISSH